MVQILRRESETPIVSAKDDAVLARYAYGGSRGIIQRVGEELSVTVDPSNSLHVTVGSGRVVIDGWEIDISSATNLMFQSSSQDSAFDYIVLNIDLLSQTADLSTVTYENSHTFASEDLTENPTGSAQIAIWSRTRKSGVPDSGKYEISRIEYLTDTIADINRRLEILGFKQGVFTFNSEDTISGVTVEFIENSLRKQGKYVIVNLRCRVHAVTGKYPVLFVIPEGFAPKEEWLQFPGYQGDIITHNNSVPVHALATGVLQFDIPVILGELDLYLNCVNIGWEVP